MRKVRQNLPSREPSANSSPRSGMVAEEQAAMYGSQMEEEPHARACVGDQEKAGMRERIGREPVYIDPSTEYWVLQRVLTY